jgi:UDP-GlcNAc:undecaprenyl-phosphate GlcNAc-1-phosphate transferase
MSLLASLLLSMFVTVITIPFLIRYAERYQLVDTPNDRKVHKQVIPRIGGISMVCGALIPVAIWFPVGNTYIALMMGVLTIFVFGIWDDRKDINYKYKFVGQLIATCWVVFYGDIYLKWLPFMGLETIAPWIAKPLTIICLLAITNAMNLADGLDGLAGGTTVLSFGLIGMLSYQSGAWALLIVTLSVVGSILGFLRFNSHPAKIFMGDTGSQFLGFILGVQVILLTQFFDSTISPALPLLIFGLPIIDTVSVMVIRLRAGRSPFSPDKQHIHHRLLALGFSHYETVVAIYLLQAGFVVLAYILRFHSDAVIAMVYIVSITLMFGFLVYFETKNIRYSRLQRSTRFIYKQINRVDKATWLTGMVRFFYWCMVSYLVIYTSYLHKTIRDLSDDVGALSGVLVVIFAISLWLDKHSSWLESIGSFTFCALLAYLGFHYPPMGLDNIALEWCSVIVLASIVVLCVLLSGEDRFQTSPLDILVVILAVLIPNLAEKVGSTSLLTLSVVKFIALVYSVEYLQKNISTTKRKGLTLLMLGCSTVLTFYAF